MAKRKFTFATGIEDEPTVAETETKETKAEELKEEKSIVQELVEKIDTPINTAFNFKFVKRSKMVFHEKNDYPMEKVEELAESILNYGLIHNIEVFYDIEKDQYIIDSGEQRTRAIDFLIEKYHEYEDTDSEEYKKYLRNVKQFEDGYPCNVKTQNHDESLSEKQSETLDQIDTEIRLIIANELSRGKDTVRTKKHIDRLNELYSERNSTLQRKDKVNVNKEIAKQLNISDKQVKVYKDINKLIPELQKKFEENQISLNEGANYAKLTEEEQRKILTLIENGEDKKEIQILTERLKQMKKDIAVNEDTISNLTDEVQKKEAIIADIQAHQKELEDQIKKEVEDGNALKLEQLKNEMESSNAKLASEKKALEESVNKKDEMITSLEKKLKAKDEVTHKNTNVMRAQAKIETNIEILKSTTQNLEKACKEYQKEITSEEEKEELERYITQINGIFQKYSNILK